MGFFTFLAVAATAYFAWRIMDQLPDVVFRLSEIQRDVAELRRQLDKPPAADPAPAAEGKSAADTGDGEG